MDSDSNLIEVPFGSPGDADPTPYPMTPVPFWEAEIGPELRCPHPDCNSDSGVTPFRWELRRSYDDQEERRADVAKGTELWRHHMLLDHGMQMLTGSLDGQPTGRV